MKLNSVIVVGSSEKLLRTLSRKSSERKPLLTKLFITDLHPDARNSLPTSLLIIIEFLANPPEHPGIVAHLKLNNTTH